MNRKIDTDQPRGIRSLDSDTDKAKMLLELENRIEKIERALIQIIDKISEK